MFSAAIARSPIVPLFAEPSLRAEQVSQLVLGRDSERAREQRGVAASVLFVSTDTRGGHTPATCWRSMRVPPTGGGPRPPDGALAQSSGWVRTPCGFRFARVSPSKERPFGCRAEGAGNSSKVRYRPRARRALRRAARRPSGGHSQHFSGASYEWGGVTPWGVDCSGLVQTTFAARGIRLPRDSSQQIGCGVEVSGGPPQPGDLLFFRGETTPKITHVAFADDGRCPRALDRGLRWRRRRVLAGRDDGRLRCASGS